MIKIPFIHKKGRIIPRTKRLNNTQNLFRRAGSRFLPKEKTTSLRNPGRFGLYLIATVLIGLFLFWIGNMIYSLISFDIVKAYRDDKSLQDIEWKGEDRIHILIVGFDRRDGEFGFVDALTLLMVDPRDNSLGIFNINVDASLYDTQSDRFISLRKRYNYSVLENTSIPIYSLVENVESLLSVTIDRYILLDEEGVIELVDALGGVYVTNDRDLADEDITTSSGSYKLRSGSFRLGGEDFLAFLQADDDSYDYKMMRHSEGTKGFISRSTGYAQIIHLPRYVKIVESKAKTNMTKYELLRLGYEIMNLDQINFGYSGLSSFKKKKVNGNIYYIPLYEVLDEDIQTVFVDSRIGKEQARVEVFNSTNVGGLASFRARWMRNVGIDVIRVGDSSIAYEETTIYTKDEKTYYYTINAIERIFKENVEVRVGKPDFITTGDIVVVIGANVE